MRTSINDDIFQFFSNIIAAPKPTATRPQNPDGAGITPKKNNISSKIQTELKLTCVKNENVQENIILGVMDQKITPTIDNVHQRKANANKSEITWGKNTPSKITQPFSHLIKIFLMEKLNYHVMQ